MTFDGAPAHEERGRPLVAAARVGRLPHCPDRGQPAQWLAGLVFSSWSGAVVTPSSSSETCGSSRLSPGPLALVLGASGLSVFRPVMATTVLRSAAFFGSPLPACGLFSWTAALRPSA